LISGCFPCAQCCGDGKDEFAAECANNKKCKVRPTPCIRVDTTPSKPANRNYSSSKPTKRNYSTSNTSTTVQTAGDRTTMTVNEEENSLFGELSISITPTSAFDNGVLKDGRVESGKQDGISIVVILLIIAAALCVVLSISVIVKRFIPVRYMLRSSMGQDSNNEGCNISQGGTLPLPHSSARSSQDSATPLLNRSESPQPNGYATPQHMVSTSLHTNEAVSSQRNESESPEPNKSTTAHSSDSLSPQAREYEPPQPNISRSVSPQPSESVSSQPDGSASTHPNQSAAAAAQSNRPAQEQVKSNPDSKPLSSLLEKESDLQKICECLDTHMAGVGHYRGVALYYGSSHCQIVSVFEKHWGGPSRALIESLKAKKPELTVAEFASVVRKEANRNDVVKLLEEYNLK